jgi:hypothetical protein
MNVLFKSWKGHISEWTRGWTLNASICNPMIRTGIQYGRSPTGKIIHRSTPDSIRRVLGRQVPVVKFDAIY